MYSRLEVAACAKRIGKSVPTAWRWIREGCRIDEPRSLKAFLIAKQVKRTNIEKSRERRSESNQKAQRISPESSANAFAAPGNGQTLPSAGKRGAAAALERLEAAEESAHRRLQAALSGGDRFAIADAQDFWLKCSETLRRLDLAVETARREAETQIPLRVAQDAVTFSAEWLRIAIAQFLSAETGSLMAIKDPGEFRYYFGQRFRGVLNLTVMGADKTNSAIPDWARNGSKLRGMLRSKSDPLANGVLKA